MFKGLFDPSTFHINLFTECDTKGLPRVFYLSYCLLYYFNFSFPLFYSVMSFVCLVAFLFLFSYLCIFFGEGSARIFCPNFLSQVFVFLLLDLESS